MDRLQEVEKAISSLKNVGFSEGASIENCKKISTELSLLLSSDATVQLLKQQNEHFQVVLPLFTRVIFHSDPDVAQHCFKHLDLMMEVFQSKLPNIKKEDWWKRFEMSKLLKLIPTLEKKVLPIDGKRSGSWVQIWIFVTNLIINKNSSSATPLNKLLSISEIAFKAGKEHLDVLENAWRCWMALIDAFGRCPNIFTASKTLNLLMKPLQACSTVSKYRIRCWVHLIEIKGLPGPEETVKQIVEPLCNAMYKAGEKSISRHLPDDCTEALTKILSYSQVVDCSLLNIIEMFGLCVTSRPSAGSIQQLSSTLIKVINDFKDDSKSYKFWKVLIEQTNSFSESPLLFQSCLTIFTDVNFTRWVESGTINVKEMAQLMQNSVFRDKVLMQAIMSMSMAGDEDNSNVKKSRKGSLEEIWNNYCDAYILWWSSLSPPTPNETATASVQEKYCFQAVQFLLLHPIKNNTWNPTVFKTWALLCESSHNHRLLHLAVKPIFDALDTPDYPVQKAIDVSLCLFGLDNSFCKHSMNVLDSLASHIHSMEVKSVMDVLNIAEIAVLHPEMYSPIGRILKFVNEKCTEYDQLVAHKIRTKAGKITRKLEQRTNSGEEDKPAKSPRPPFRTRSNFLQRLAKAEEKNKTKVPFLTSIFASSEKAEIGDDIKNNDIGPMDTSLENGENMDNGVKPSSQDDSENLPIIVLPSVRSSPAKENIVSEGIKEKENVIFTSSATIPTITSPSCKLKITNAREVKAVDASSPVPAKKPKPAAGQKTTPKKVTPSKVSYFDDDANDCVMVPPKQKTTPLTEHQMEMMSKRRTDIPALYQDLSQDTQISQPPSAVIQEIPRGASPQHAGESQDIVPGTPSPQDCPALLTPKRSKNNDKSGSSTKKLDFNLQSTPPSQTSLFNGSFPNDTLSTPVKGEGEQLPPSSQSEKVNGLSTPDTAPSNEVPEGDNTERSKGKKPVSQEKIKRKRKSEPIKFSPKLTRSKQKVRSVTPDCKFKSTEQDLIPQSSSSEIDAKLLRPKFPEPGVEALGTKSPEPEDKNEQSKPLPGLNLSGIPDDFSKEETPEKPAESDATEEKSVKNSETSTCNSSNGLPSFQSTFGGTEQEKPQKEPKKSRKRKNDDLPNEEFCKKAKSSDDSAKKCKEAKRKKPLKLGSGGKLENWLLKADRISCPSPKQSSENDKKSGDLVNSENNLTVELNSVDLNNSDEIVPSTQEVSVVNQAIASVAEPEVSEKSLAESVVVSKNIPDGKDDLVDVDKASEQGESKSAHESSNDDIDLIISPSRRQRRASSVFRDEGDTYLTKNNLPPEVEESKDESKVRRNKTSPSTKKSLHPAGGRSAKMLRLLTNTTSQDDDNIPSTPVRKRESITPLKYGENWPKGHTEDWVARTPVSPYASPFRSALRKPIGPEENTTPQRSKNSLASPLLSSAKRKRVVFFDPPVTCGLIYEVDSPFGSVHHADVPQGSPYPTWTGDDDKLESKTDDKEDISPAKKESCRPSEKPDCDTVLKPPDVSNEVRMLVNPTVVIPSPEIDLNRFQEKFLLTDDFMAIFSENDKHIRSLLVDCFESFNMTAVVDEWKFGDCRRICQLPHSLLCFVKNANGQVLTEILSAAVFAAPSSKPPPQFADSSIQAGIYPSQSASYSQTERIPLANSESQTTIVKTRSAETNTSHSTSTSSTQADQTLPAMEDLAPILENISPQQALLYFSESLRLLSSLPIKK